jgi:S-ribosylhomocysteine lyase
MVDVSQLGWVPATVGELDHRLLKAPSVKLRSFTVGPNGDVVYCVDLRISQPNEDFVPITEMHSLEHFLLAGFEKYLPLNFISIGLMGCQTGFYLVLLNEGRAEKICKVYENILTDVLNASEVPYATIGQCGNYQNHNLELTQHLARKVLQARLSWRQVI